MRQQWINAISELEDDELESIYLIAIELKRAQFKHSEWPKDLIHQSAIVQEEAGELTRACLHEVYEKGSFEKCIEEAKQTAAMGLRFMLQR